ncbi:MAG: hypothetical protein IPK80_08530 [Nannocystis sp.]|nr:hypothetical protein [Nannocystis sp.]
MTAELTFPLLSLMIAVPLVAALATALGGTLVTRRAAIVAALIDVGLAIAALVVHLADPSLALADPLDPLTWLFGHPVLRLDRLSAPLLVFAALISLVAVMVAPRTALRASLLRRNLFAQAVLLATFATREPAVMAAMWCLGALPPLLELRSAGAAGRPALRVFAIYMGAGAAAFIGGVALTGGEHGLLASVLLVLAVMIRKGIFPLHSWMPELFEHAPLGVSTLFNAPQVGAYVAATLVIPSEPAAALDVVGVASIITALYGSAMALVQRGARRAYGYIFMSQSALVMLGFECLSAEGVTGALAFWLSSGVALAGLGLALWVLEARRGALRVDRLHGGYERTPLLATMFLVFGVGTVGFPGTYGFVGQEMLLDGAVHVFPGLSVAVALASALGGLAVMRIYFSLFTGAPAQGGLTQRLHRRERLGFALLGAVLLVFGIWPRPAVELQSAVAAELLRARAVAVEGR